MKVIALKCLLVFGCLSMIIACSNDPESLSETGQFEKTIQLAAISDTLHAVKDYDNFTETVLANPADLVNLNDSILVVLERRNQDFISVFEIPGINYLYSFGSLSRGPEPDEFVSPVNYINANVDQLITYEVASKSLKYLSISHSGVAKIKEGTLGYDDQMAPLDRVRHISGGLFFADYGTSDEKTNSEYVAIEFNKSDTLFTFGEYPESESTGFLRYAKFMKTNVSNRSGDRFAAFYLFLNRFKIFNQRGDELMQVNLNDPVMMNENSFEERIIQRSTAWASDDFIYTIGLNGTSDELFDKPTEAGTPTFFEVWDWEGNSIYRAYFDRLITRYVVSETERKIYALPKIGESSIIEYQLPNLK